MPKQSFCFHWTKCFYVFCEKFRLIIQQKKKSIFCFQPTRNFDFRESTFENFRQKFAPKRKAHSSRFLVFFLLGCPPTSSCIRPDYWSTYLMHFLPKTWLTTHPFKNLKEKIQKIVQKPVFTRKIFCAFSHKNDLDEKEVKVYDEFIYFSLFWMRPANWPVF